MMACAEAGHCCSTVPPDLRDLTSSADFQTRMTFPEPSPASITSSEPRGDRAGGVARRVVFTAHFDRRFGLPASSFFRGFLEFFGLQPHHLPANAFVTLSCYVAFCEGYAGVWPDVDFWSRLFFIKAQTTDGQLRACGVASLYPCPQAPFPKIPTVDSVKKWQTSFFYVKNENPAVDRLNLPPFSLAPPTKMNWGYCHKPTDPQDEVNLLLNFLRTCVTQDRLTAADLLCTFISRRVLPLQRRSHKIGHMSGRFDPTRTSKVELTGEGVASRVNYISNARLPDDWQWGMEPFSRHDPLAVNFPRMLVEDGNLAEKVWEADHADPADRAVGEDENPDAAHQAVEGQGEPSSPPQPEEEEEVAVVGPLHVAPLAAVPPAAGAGQPSRGRKRTTAQLEAALKRQRRLQPKQVPEAAGAPIKFKGVGASSASGTISPLPVPPRTRREPTPQPLARERARTPPVFPLPSVGAGTSSSAPPPASSGSGSRDEPARRTSQPTIGDLLQRRRPEVPPTGAGEAAPGAGAGSGPRVTPPPPPPEPMVTSAPAGQAVPPPASELARDEPARSASADAGALVKAKGPAKEPQGSSQPLVSLHVAPAASLAHVVSASDSSLGSMGTMEKEWRDADVHEVTSREGRKGVAPMELFFADFRTLLTASAAETDTRLKRCEKVAKTVTDKRADLYNRLVASYHKVKTERSEMARELEAARAVAAQVPQLQEELRLSRAQCAASQETAKALAAQAKETEGELARLRRLEANHLTELEAAKRVEQEKVDDLNRRLAEVNEQCQKLSSDMAAQSKVLSETSKRWVDEISALDRGLAGIFALSFAGFRLVAGGYRFAGWLQADLNFVFFSGFWLRLVARLCRLLSAEYTGFLRFFFVSAAFPETQEAALVAAGREREARRQAGEDGSSHFSMDDHLAAMQAQITPITMLGYELRQAAEELYRLLWPTETLPGEIANLVKWLENAPDCLLDWKESAARAGADMALSFVLSWYQEVSLDQLESRRASVEDTLSAEDKTRRLARACAIVDYVDPSVFINDPDLPEEGPGEDEEMADAKETAAPEADLAAGLEAPPASPSPAGV
ncbi:hypothetical protein ACQ4PT_022202 [Festuca glaucescens]